MVHLQLLGGEQMQILDTYKAVTILVHQVEDFRQLLRCQKFDKVHSCNQKVTICDTILLAEIQLLYKGLLFILHETLIGISIDTFRDLVEVLLLERATVTHVDVAIDLGQFVDMVVKCEIYEGKVKD